MSHLMQNYAPLPVSFVRGEGAYLEDTKGKRYLDGLCGLAVTGLGHAHPGVTQALSQQAASVLHTSNLYQIDAQTQLAERLCTMSGMERAFFGNSGAEANEAAIKIARLWGNRAEQPKHTIIVMDGSFHGRTMATLTATGNRKAQAGFEPLLSGFVRAPFDDVEAIEQIAENNTDVMAVFVEPVLGEGGIILPAADYLTHLRRICDNNGWLLMLDEVQTGNGRTGKLFAYQHTDVMPDVVTTAKGLGNGVPIGACLARGEAAEVLTPGTHGSTFGGNPMVCAAANAVLDALEDGSLMTRVGELGERIRAGLATRLQGNNRVKDIRGMGLMIGIELSDRCGQLVQAGLDRGVLINVTRDNVLRLLPPLILSDEQADALCDHVAALVEEQ